VSLISIFTKQAPNIAGVTFDAVLEDQLTISVELTAYPVESGARVNDHRIVNPIKWVMTGAISDNELQTSLTDFLGGALSNITGNGILASFGGLSAGFLGGDTDRRSSAALQFLIELMMSGDPFSVDAGDIQLNNMVITRLSRGKDPETEGALIFVAELQELITLDRLPVLGQPQQYQLRVGDVAKSAVAGLVKKGQAAVKEASAAVTKAANDVLSGVF
jgi:hypothetical protein